MKPKDSKAANGIGPGATKGARAEAEARERARVRKAKRQREKPVQFWMPSC